MTDRTFQTRVGVYAFCADFYAGQNDRLYRIMSRMKIRLSDQAWRAIRCAQCDPNGEWEIARQKYHQMKEKYLG